MTPDEQLAMIAKAGLAVFGVIYGWPFLVMCWQAWMEW
jgi:hypothetical protein